MDIKGLQELAEISVATLRDVIGDLDPSDTRIVQGRLAAGSLASYSRIEQTQGAREAVRFGMAERAEYTPEELREYIHLAMPDHKILLTKGTKNAKG